MKAINMVLNIVTWLFLIGVIIVAVITIGSNTSLLGGYKSYLIQSGSMEPTIMTGDLIVAHKNSNYAERDVVTFIGEDHRVVTHRILKISGSGEYKSFLTKGDANRSEDEGTITQDDVLGKVVLVIPKLGYFVVFAQSLPGLILLIGVPAFLIIFGEVLEILRR